MPNVKVFPKCAKCLIEGEVKCLSCGTEISGGGNHKEALLDSWKQVADEHRLVIKEYETFKKLEQEHGVFRVLTTSEKEKPEPYIVRKVLLAIGTHGSPMNLRLCPKCGTSLNPKDKQCYFCNHLLKNVSLESPLAGKIHYQLGNAAEYAGKSVLVIGGGNSAVEAAVALCGHQRNKDDKSEF